MKLIISQRLFIRLFFSLNSIDQIVVMLLFFQNSVCSWLSFCSSLNLLQNVLSAKYSFYCWSDSNQVKWVSQCVHQRLVSTLKPNSTQTFHTFLSLTLSHSLPLSDCLAWDY